ncbi:hypothetical protein Sru01_23210 [Sphaerisporangium rufum]|uniref:Uncharacterized protein n=1 Tax=Sphaerisporangium rufum TaxID=1381558 RepID=A0A919UZ22_9ACTN|nr:hypothetical protein [Sphaerisporangium rufum]GII77339.1 hypothetical protein Sru01_23210 [Sphaerisporangium rufum]
MPDNGTERLPDPRVAFAGVRTADTGESDDRPGTVDQAVVVAGEGEYLPPMADRSPDARPLAQRFTEPEED